MFTIDLSAKIKDLNGNEHQQSYGQAVADIVLARASTGPVVTMMKWAFELNADKPIRINKRDVEMIRGLVENNNTLCNFVKLPVMDILDNAEPDLEQVEANTK